MCCCTRLGSIGVLCQATDAHKIRWEEEYERMKQGNSFSFRTLQVALGTLLHLTSLNRPLIVPVCDCLEYRVSLFTRGASLGASHDKGHRCFL